MNRYFQTISLIVFLGVTSYLACTYKEISVRQVFPDLPWASVVPTTDSIPGIGVPSAKNCGSCHTEIYQEWSKSTHSQAYYDTQFQAELAKESSPKWLCLNCHIPVGNQRESLVNYLKDGDPLKPVETPNPGYMEIMKGEGVTCATCHLKHDESGNPYILGSHGDTKPPHPIKVDRNALANRCNDCHNQTYTLNKSLVCYFQTGDELAKAQEVHPGKDCATCHLPTVKRSLVKSELERPVRTAHRHGFIGGGIPKSFDLYPYQIPNGYIPGVVIEDVSFSKNIFTFTIYNKNSGHSMPSGDPERFLKWEVEMIDSDGSIVEKTSGKISQEWEWQPVAKQISDNRILSGEKRKITFSPKSNGIFEAKIVLTHIRFKNSTAEYVALTSDSVPEEFRTKVKNIQNNYPHSSIIAEVIWNSKSNKAKFTSLEELFQRNELRRGE